MMKNILLAIMFMLCGCLTLSAQDHKGKDRKEMFREIQEFKMKYLAQEMELEEGQKEEFFKLYDELNQKRVACMKPAWRLDKELKKKKDATEDDYKRASEAMNRAKEECAEIDSEYDAKFSKFLSQKQIFKMKKAEEEFRKKMEEMRRSKKNRR